MKPKVIAYLAYRNLAQCREAEYSPVFYLFLFTQFNINVYWGFEITTIITVCKITHSLL